MNPLLALPTAFTKLATFGLLLAQAATDDTTVQTAPPGAAAGAAGGIFGLIVAVVAIVSMWKIFTKAGQPGWASLIPIYNIYILLKISGKPGWWILLLLIPFVNFIILIILFIALAKSFGKGAGFGIGLALLGIIFLPVLAFGDARYQGPAGAGAPALV